MNLDPGGLIAWLVVGLIAGWLAGKFMKGGGYGVVGDIVLGIIGAFVGGFIFSILLPGSSAGLIGSIVVAFIGAVILIALARVLTGRRAAV
ncbi:MAG TPA: GlsB/YeaQ/YmgE family stress response membrane protein [Solirubrobacteraceae bacterium]